MNQLRIFAARVRGLVRARQSDRELDQEVAAHLDEATEELVQQGLSPEEARRAAIRSFGGVAQAQEAYREARSFMWLDHLRRDTRHAVRALRRTPGFSLVVLIVLAVGTGSVTAVFAFLNTIVLKPLPFAEADRLVVVKHAAPGLGLEEAGLSSGLYFHYRDHARSLESVAVYYERVQRLQLPKEGTERVNVAHVSWKVFHVLGVQPVLGRLFTEEDGLPGFMDARWAIPVLLAHDFWVGRLGADPAIVGGFLTIGDRRRAVVGVLPEGFTFPRSGTQIWMLSEPPNVTASFAGNLGLSAVAKLSRGVTAGAAEADLARILPSIEGAYRDATPQRIAEVRLAPRVIPLKQAVVGDVAHVIWTLFGGMALLLVIAGANAGALFLVRSEGRRREIAVRQALGAHGQDVARLFFIEALMLASAAAALGLIVAHALLIVVIALAPVELPRTEEVRLDGVAALFAAAVAVLMAVFYAMLSVRRQRHSLTVNLRSDSTWTTGVGARDRVRDPLLALQVALALTLIAGSALMVKSYRNLAQLELGFSSGSLLTMEIGLPGSRASQHVRIYDDLVDRVRRLPGVQSASVASFAPLTGSEHVFPVEAGATPIPFKFFGPGSFQTMNTPIVEGERFAPGETVSVPYPVLISAAMARRLFPNESAIGKSVRRLNRGGTIVTMGRDDVPVPPFTVAGIVADVRETSLRESPTEIVYVPVIEPSVEPSIVPISMSLIVRTTVPPFSLATAIREAITHVDPSVSLGRIRTMDAIVRASRSREAFVGVLLLLAAGASLFLGAVGIYGSVSQVVRRRTREIGIRMALGATRPEVVRMVASGSMRAVLVGAGLGVLLALAAARTLSSLLFGVESGDLTVLLIASSLLLATSLAAALLAARRAAGINPIRALRSS